MDAFSAIFDLMDQKASTIYTGPKLQLPAPSDEQQPIIDRFIQADATHAPNVKVEAIPGAGKTTLALLISERVPEKQVAILSYNTQLTNETRIRARCAQLTNVQVRTYHSAIGRMYNKVVRN